MKEIVDLDEFNTELKNASNKLVVIDYFATWCGPCKMVAPKVEALEKKFSDVIFLKVDVDEAEDLAAEHQVKAMPTFKLFKSSEEIAEVVGAAIDKLEDAIKANI